MVPVAWELVIWVGAALLLLLMLTWLFWRDGRKRRALVINAATGLGTWLLWNALLMRAGWGVQVNVFSLAAVGALGAPGVALAALLQKVLV